MNSPSPNDTYFKIAPQKADYGSWTDADGEWRIWITAPINGIEGQVIDCFILQPNGTMFVQPIGIWNDPITGDPNSTPDQLKAWLNANIIPRLTQIIAQAVKAYHTSQIEQAFLLLDNLTVIPSTDPPQIAPLP